MRDRIALFGGSLEVESEPGKGTRARIEVPLERGVPSAARAPASATEQPDAPAERSPAVGTSSAGRIRVLLVDDHEVMRDGLASLLEEEGLEVVGEAGDGVDALELAPRLRPDVVLMDFSMPRMDGVEATRRLCREMPGLAVIGLSMYEEAERAEAMLQAGAAAYLSKTEPSERLVDTVREVYRRSAGGS